MLKKILALCSCAVLSVSIIAVTAGSASAWPSNFDPGQEFRYNYNSYAYRASHDPDTGAHGVGSETDFYSDVTDLASYKFYYSGDGQGTFIKNNAGSAYNISGRVVNVYYNSYNVMGCWCGSHDVVGWAGHDLTVTYNNNASHHATSQVA